MFKAVKAAVGWKKKKDKSKAAALDPALQAYVASKEARQKEASPLMGQVKKLRNCKYHQLFFRH